MRQCSGFTDAFVYRFCAVRQALRQFWGALILWNLHRQEIKVDFEDREVLTHAIMQLPTHLSSFLVLQFENTAAEPHGSLLRCFPPRDVGVQFQPSDGSSFRVAQSGPSAFHGDGYAVPPGVSQ